MAIKKIFLKLLLICPFKDQNFAENLTNWAEDLFLKLNSAEFMEFFFSKSAPLVSGNDCNGIQCKEQFIYTSEGHHSAVISYWNLNKSIYIYSINILYIFYFKEEKKVTN